MTTIQIFQLFGLAFTALGVGMLINPDTITKILDELEHSPVDVYLTGLVSLTVGFLLVTFNNSWSFDSALIITLIGWSGLIKGITMLVYPSFTLRIAEMVVKNDVYLTTASWVSAALGIVCLYFGYVA